MVLRLFVQPGESQHWIVVQRPEPLPANATPSAAVLASTVLAAGYTSFSTRYDRRAGLPGCLSGPATFIRASARAGIWCAAAGAAVNWYYHYGFATPLLHVANIFDGKWQLYEKTHRYTIDDGFLVGASVGLLSSLFLRRMPISWPAKIMGMTNFGAFCGLGASNAYFQYTGERQKAVRALNDWKNRRNLEFHFLYWDALAMSKFSVLVQAYIIVSGVFHARRLPADVVRNPEHYGLGMITRTDMETKDEKEVKEGDTAKDGDTKQGQAEESDQAAKDTDTVPRKVRQHFTRKHTRQANARPEQRSYVDPPDPLKVMEELTPEEVKKLEQTIDGLRYRHRELWKEIDYITHEVQLKEYDLVHKQWKSEDERRELQADVQLLEVVKWQLYSEACEKNKSLSESIALVAQRKAWKTENDTPEQWARMAGAPERPIDRPTRLLERLDGLRVSLGREVKVFEMKLQRRQSAEDEKVTIQNLYDGRKLQDAAIRMAREIEDRASERRASEAAKRLDGVEKGTMSDAVGEEKMEKEIDKGKEKEKKGKEGEGGMEGKS